jgi:hypothetical protein
MCTLKDFDNLQLTPYHRKLLKEELQGWHDLYLNPARKFHKVNGLMTVMDLGAGCGESAWFYLNHGAERVIAVENDPDAVKLLHANFDNDPRVTIINAGVSTIKIDIEGWEEGTVIETHFRPRFRMIRGPFGMGLRMFRLEKSRTPDWARLYARTKKALLS